MRASHAGTSTRGQDGAHRDAVAVRHCAADRAAVSVSVFVSFAVRRPITRSSLSITRCSLRVHSLTARFIAHRRATRGTRRSVWTMRGSHRTESSAMRTRAVTLAHDENASDGVTAVCTVSQTRSPRSRHRAAIGSVAICSCPVTEPPRSRRETRSRSWGLHDRTTELAVVPAPEPTGAAVPGAVPRRTGTGQPPADRTRRRVMRVMPNHLSQRHVLRSAPCGVLR